MPRPSSRDPETDPAAFLGERLRLGRVAAGYASQDALAAKLGFDRTVIGKAETGDRPPTRDVLAAWCELCGLDLDMHTGLAKLARSAHGPVPTWFETWLEAEQSAMTLRIWQPLIVPGLLQIAEYARELFLAAGVDSDTADDMVSARLERQDVLDRLNPPHAVIVLNEPVLHHLIGSPQVMHDQLTHVAKLSERPHTVIQVVPASNGANAGLGGALNIASGDRTPNVLLTEAVEDQTTESRSLLSKASATFDLVRADALPRVTSRTLILEAAGQWQTR
jgi:transcriptional regulator with XRE-family HTH domain